MATKIVLNKKNAKDDYGILSIQSFNGNGKKKKSLGIRVENPVKLTTYFRSKLTIVSG